MSMTLYLISNVKGQTKEAEYSLVAKKEITQKSNRFKNLEVFPIERDIVWVRGNFIVTYGGEIYNSKFYDSLVIRGGNRYVIMSVLKT